LQQIIHWSLALSCGNRRPVARDVAIAPGRSKGGGARMRGLTPGAPASYKTCLCRDPVFRASRAHMGL